MASGGSGRLPLSRLLIQHRKSSGLTQEELAEKSGVSTRAISDLERGLVRRPQRRTSHALAVALALGERDRSEFLRVVGRGEPTPRVVPPEPAAQPDPLPRELPPEVADLAGREDELAELIALLDDESAPVYRTATVISVHGAPGVGKTTFAVHAGHRLADRYPDGSLFVNLRGTSPEPITTEQALGMVLVALGVAEQQLPPHVDERAGLYRSLLRGRRMALLLDNAADEAQVRPLLPSSPGCLVLVTSRRVLSGLESVARMQLDVLRPADSVRLLRSIIGASRASAEPESVRRVAALCGNLPLALRIAGNRLATRPRWLVDNLVRQLDDEQRRLNALTAGDLEVRAAFEVSYRQCDPETRSVFRRISLVTGPDFAADVVAALSATDRDTAERSLEELVDASMLEGAPVAGRYVLHDLMRVFAGERLALEEPAEQLRATEQRMTTWLLTTGTHAGVLLSPPGCLPTASSPQDTAIATRTEAIDWLDTEKPLWLAALRHEAAADRHAEVLAFSHAVHSYSEFRTDPLLWCEVFGHGVASARALGMRAEEAVQLNFLGAVLSAVRGRHDEALRAHERAWRVARETGNRKLEAWALQHCGRIQLMLGRPTEAAERIRAALAVFHELGEPFGKQVALSLLGMALHQVGRFEEAITVHRKVVGYYRSPEMVQYRNHLAVSLLRLADALEAAGQSAEAAEAFRESLGLAADDHFAVVEGLASFGLARCQEALGNRAVAAELLGRALEVFTEIGESGQQERVLALLATVDPDRSTAHRPRPDVPDRDTLRVRRVV
ncbi:tetratricopeptide repeat protein [Solihabitans fulvus]|uniref:Tetratricopeptide repeat protein n=1 Tax=Solihabitans fulvus TaxID=1892852 RepID=A0A5B2X4B6_9PSEU|nr:helix-turn-helix domain-containing protein [Solihabitans fulvus]KAA2258074.1 tetratricopeptide repeat protein [Solihabitans fulvus]